MRESSPKQNSASLETGVAALLPAKVVGKLYPGKYPSSYLLIYLCSGWNEDDYYNAAVKAYHGAKTKPSTVTIDNDNVLEESDKDDSVGFRIQRRVDILKHHEKWQATLSKAETKRKKGSVSSLDSSSNGDDNVDYDSKHQRPIGNKKAKTVLAIKNSAESLIDEMRQQQAVNMGNRDKVVLDVLEQMKQSATDSVQHLRSIVSDSTNKLERVMRMKLRLGK